MRVACSEAFHVGDSQRNDVEGAAAVGIPAVLLDRRGDGRQGTIHTLAALAPLLS